MTWFKVDDRFHSHPKAAASTLAALGLWAVAGSWSSDHLTDGFMPDHVIPQLSRGASELADELVAAGLWRRVRGGYRFHQWGADSDGSKRNPTRKEVEEERRKKADAGRLGGLASGQKRRSRNGNGPKKRPVDNAVDNDVRAAKPPVTSAGTRSTKQARASPPASGLVEPPTRPPPSEKEDGERARADAGRSALPAAQTRPPSSNGMPASPPDLTETRALIAAGRRKYRAAPRTDALEELRAITPDVVVFDAEPETEAPGARP